MAALTLSPTVTVEIAFSAGASTSAYLHFDDTARGKFDTGTFAPDITWTDVSPYVYAITTGRGSNRVESPVVRYESGTCTIVLDNSDRRFDPTHLTGPYVAAGVTQVTPMRAVRVLATYNSVTYDVWRGFADSWQITYQQPAYSEVALAATDATKVLTNYDRVAVSAVGAGEDSGARVNRILDSVSWQATDRVVVAGDSTLQATTLDGDAWTELLLVQDSEIGEIYVDGAGRVVFRNRQAIVEDTRSNTSQATFGDAVGEMEYDNLTVDYDDTAIANLVRIARVGGTQQTAQDTTSQANNLIHTHERTDLLLETDAAALEYANYILFQAKDPELRFAEITLDPQGDTAFEDLLYPQVLGRQIGDRITVKRTPPGGGAVINRDVFVRGIRHEIDVRNGTWKTVWTLQSASKFSFLIFDHASLGTFDANSFGF